MINQYYNKLTKPIRDSKITEILKSIDTTKIFPADVEFNFKERLAVKNELISQFIPWVGNFLNGLSAFTHKYIANGNSDALNMVFMKKGFNRVCFLKNEYSYYSYLCKTLNIEYLELETFEINLLSSTDLFLISLPSSYDGSSTERIEMINQLQQAGMNIFIDIAYCGLTDPFYLNLTSTKNTVVSFTFSKSSSLSYNRIALMFSDSEIPSLEIMNKIGYVNLAGANAAIAIMKSIPVDYFYINYKDQYEDICKSQNITPTKCILFGHDQNNDKFCTTPYYKTT